MAGRRRPNESYEPSWDDCAQGWLVVLQVAQDRSIPIDITSTRTSSTLGPAQGPCHRFAGGLFDARE